jgi:hypothetical protein
VVWKITTFCSWLAHVNTRSYISFYGSKQRLGRHMTYCVAKVWSSIVRPERARGRKSSLGKMQRLPAAAGDAFYAVLSFEGREASPLFIQRQSHCAASLLSSGFPVFPSLAGFSIAFIEKLRTLFLLTICYFRRHITVSNLNPDEDICVF